MRLTVAGRTDAGVHAWGQVASFEHDGAPPEGLAARLNGVVPEDLAVKRADAVADGFDARGDARSRTYCYRVLVSAAPNPFEDGRALWWPHPLDVDALDACAALLAGNHDFTAFTPTETHHTRFEREIYNAEWRAVRNPAEPNIIPAESSADASGSAGYEPLLEFWVEGDTFMRHVVRVLVGTMLEVGRGRRTPEDFGRLLEGAPRDAAGDTGQPHGLYLASVRY